jgi:hypothetical protein
LAFVLTIASQHGKIPFRRRSLPRPSVFRPGVVSIGTFFCLYIAEDLLRMKQVLLRIYIPAFTPFKRLHPLRGLLYSIFLSLSSIF